MKLREFSDALYKGFGFPVGVCWRDRVQHYADDSDFEEVAAEESEKFKRRIEAYFSMKFLDPDVFDGNEALKLHLDVHRPDVDMDYYKENPLIQLLNSSLEDKFVFRHSCAEHELSDLRADWSGGRIPDILGGFSKKTRTCFCLLMKRR